MSTSYTWIGWTRHKKRYDAVMLTAVAGYLAAFITGGVLIYRPPDQIALPVLLIRALGTCAIVMLHIVLWIGPLARLNRRFLPLLFNRRHLGVATFLIALSHAAMVLIYYHAFGNLNPFLSLLTSNTAYGSLSRFPFETPGLLALLILFLMAATSHDFWLRNLTARAWKRLHMLIYAAYALLIAHIALGALQHERSIVYPILLTAGAAITISLHLITGLREARKDSAQPPAAANDGFIDVASVDDIPDRRAIVVSLPSRERIAVFRYDGKVSAVTNVCEHQGGPLGEGKVIDGCITCPWHGWQYRPGDGCSPPPFTEKIPTYEVRISARRVLINPQPRPRGTPVHPAIIPGAPA
ncbi:MAG: ferric reductase-like transmembrane domain-containing protein [Phycisphaerales bacterium]|nr:ferric reductase-like transmembrane domain-containing protein [Phycisphaerales bacterium]